MEEAEAATKLDRPQVVIVSSHAQTAAGSESGPDPADRACPGTKRPRPDRLLRHPARGVTDRTKSQRCPPVAARARQGPGRGRCQRSAPTTAEAHPADRCYDHDTYRRLLWAHGFRRGNDATTSMKASSASSSASSPDGTCSAFVRPQKEVAAALGKAGQSGLSSVSPFAVPG